MSIGDLSKAIKVGVGVYKKQSFSIVHTGRRYLLRKGMCRWSCKTVFYNLTDNLTTFELFFSCRHSTLLAYAGLFHTMWNLGV